MPRVRALRPRRFPDLPASAGRRAAELGPSTPGVTALLSKLLKLVERELLLERGVEEGAPPSAAKVASILRSRKSPPNQAFDRFLAPELRAVSRQYWTPLAVAARAAEWIDELGIETVFDVGSGAGKFCVAAALAGHARFVGIEQRARLVAAARELARVFEVEARVTFIHGTFDGTLMPNAEAYYFYNSFGENLFSREDRLDDDTELSDARYLSDIAAAERLLREASVGTYLLTYNGFGGQVPEGYTQVRVEPNFPCVLEMWRKTEPTRLERASASRASAEPL